MCAGVLRRVLPAVAVRRRHKHSAAMPALMPRIKSQDRNTIDDARTGTYHEQKHEM
jgi:hypothetical protein